MDGVDQEFLDVRWNMECRGGMTDDGFVGERLLGWSVEQAPLPLYVATHPPQLKTESNSVFHDGRRGVTEGGS